MSQRKPLAVLAAVAAVLALAVPVAGASAAPTARTAVTRNALIYPIVVGGRLVPGSLPCRIMIRQIQLAVASGNTVWANYVSTVFIYSGCGGAAI